MDTVDKWIRSQRTRTSRYDGDKPVGCTPSELEMLERIADDQTNPTGQNMASSMYNRVSKGIHLSVKQRQWIVEANKRLLQKQEQA